MALITSIGALYGFITSIGALYAFITVMGALHGFITIMGAIYGFFLTRGPKFLSAALLYLLPPTRKHTAEGNISEQSQMLIIVFLCTVDLIDYQGVSSPRRRFQCRGRIADVNGRNIALLKYEGKVFAMDEKCPHMGKDLS